MKCEEAREALGLLVLGALESDEEALVNAHLADCGECSAEQRRMGQVVRLLPWGLPEVEPAAGIEQRLQSRIAASATRSAPRLSISRWPAWAPAAAAAVLVLTLGLSATSGLLLQRQQSMQADLDAANRKDGSDRAALAILASGSGRSLALHAAAGGGGGYGLFRMDPNNGEVVLVVQGLTAAPAGNVYQGWMRRGSERISIGVFAPQAGGAPIILTLAGQPTSLLNEVDGFGITVEPVGGSPRPTAPPIITS